MDKTVGWELDKKSEPKKNVYRKGKYLIESETTQEYWTNFYTGQHVMLPLTVGRMYYLSTNKFLNKT